MPESEKVSASLASSLECASSLIQQLEKAFVELEALEDASTDNVEWKDVERHFRFLETEAKKKVEELESKEKEVTEREFFLAEREAEVIAKEQDLLDRVQELKDAAVDAIIEAKAVCKVSCSVNHENAEVVAAELKKYCERMDSKGLLKYVMENLDNLSSVCRQQLPIVLDSAAEPARLVLDALEGFFPPNEMTNNGVDEDEPLLGMRQSCLVLMESLCAFLGKKAFADSSADSILNPETKQLAKAIADEWNPKLAPNSIDATNGKSLEARAFLQLLVTFRIASEFDGEELCKLVLATAHHRQATELCRSIELTHKVPGIVETLLGSGRNIEAVNFILTFKLSEAFPPVPLLKSYLKELRRNLQGNGDIDTQNDFNARELAAVKAVIRCVKEHRLEPEYPIDPLQKRFLQLQSSVSDRKRKRERGGKCGEKESQVNGESRESRNRKTRARVSGSVATRYPPPAGRSSYGFPIPGQSAYATHATGGRAHKYPFPSKSTSYVAQGKERRLHHYARNGTSAPHSASSPGYGAYVQPRQRPYMNSY